MRILIIVDSFPPLRNSGAVQIWDLAQELVRQGHSPTVLFPTSEIETNAPVEIINGVRVVRLKTPNIKHVNLIKRTVFECLLPIFVRLQLWRNKIHLAEIYHVVWYSPTIFFGPLVGYFKRKYGASSYLIIRDIFPNWALDVGLIKRRGPVFWFFEFFAKYQYSVADTIGVQSPGNLTYFERWRQNTGRRIEVLSNWLAKPSQELCSVNLQNTKLANRKIFVYAGNMGVAQGMDVLLDLASKFKKRNDIGFLFVGRGTELPRLKAEVIRRKTENVLFLDEISPQEIPNLYVQCSIGLIALNPRHISHNIPGKFLSYLQSGLPVLANVNKGNDLGSLIIEAKVGEVCDTNDIDELYRLAERLISTLENDNQISDRCKTLFQREFSVEKAASQIVNALLK